MLLIYIFLALIVVSGAGIIWENTTGRSFGDFYLERRKKKRGDAGGE